VSSLKNLIERKATGLKQQLLKKWIRPLLSPLYLDLQPDYGASIFLAGTERSGTTWISDIINYQRDYRYLFEPFWPHRVKLCRHFKPQQYLRPQNQDVHFLQTAETILSGKIRDDWIDKYHRTFIARQRLIKDVRANLLLKWLHTHFPEMPIIFIIRHPCAVVWSQMRNSTWQPDLKKEFLAQRDLVEDFLYPVEKEMEKAATLFDILIFRWCVQNYVPLRQFKQGEIHLAFYEHFCVDPEREVARLFAYLGKTYTPRVFASVSRPSPVSRSESAIITGGSLIDNWRKRISADQVKRAMEILGLFGLDALYTEDAMPQQANVDKIAKATDRQDELDKQEQNYLYNYLSMCFFIWFLSSMMLDNLF
jgi:hypothetical protein